MRQNSAPTENQSRHHAEHELRKNMVFGEHIELQDDLLQLVEITIGSEEFEDMPASSRMNLIFSVRQALHLIGHVRTLMLREDQFRTEEKL